MNYKTIDEIRSLYPFLKQGKIYFNHASIGPLSKLVVSNLNEYIYNRSLGSIKNFDTFISADQSGREKLGKLLNCEPNRVTWVDNVSNGMSMLANSVEWQKGDEIILNDMEFPANVYPFLNLQSKGVVVKIVKSKNGKVLFNDLREAITERTKLLSISYVQFFSGYRSDLVELGKLCKYNNIIFSVDVIQAAGAFKIDVKEMNIDFLCGGTQKWLMGLQGLSYMYVAEKLQKKMKQASVGWLSVKDAWNLLDYNLTLKDDAQSFFNGSVNLIGIVAADTNLGMFLDFGIDRIERHILDNTKYLHNGLKNLGIEPILYGEDEKHLSGIVTFDIDKAEEFKNIAEKNNIIFELRQGKIRLAPHFYNIKCEFDILLNLLEDFLKK
jgi:selenocysteine lyase/cysteine desulfurase